MLARCEDIQDRGEDQPKKKYGDISEKISQGSLIGNKTCLRDANRRIFWVALERAGGSATRLTCPSP
jgi:hypothetical protein